MIKSITFHLLKPFRWLIVSLLPLFSGLFSIIALVAIFADNPKHLGLDQFVITLGLTVVFGSAAWIYDAFIKKLSLITQTNQLASQSIIL
jgi:hypothetical protein